MSVVRGLIVMVIGAFLAFIGWSLFMQNLNASNFSTASYWGMLGLVLFIIGVVLAIFGLTVIVGSITSWTES